MYIDIEAPKASICIRVVADESEIYTLIKNKNGNIDQKKPRNYAYIHTFY